MRSRPHAEPEHTPRRTSPAERRGPVSRAPELDGVDRARVDARAGELVHEHVRDGAAVAGERKVPSEYSTIQAAVNAAASGDVVVCSPGTYTEAVVATKSNITIKGTTDAYGNRCIWDGKTGTDAKTCVDITGDAVVITDFDFKNGVNHCKLKGKYNQVKKCTSKFAGRTACDIEGDYCEVNDVVVEECTSVAIKIVGKVNNVFYTSVTGCGDVGIDCDGESYGLVIDSVGEVLKLRDDSREPVPVNLDQRLARVAACVHRLDQELLVVLDVERLLDMKPATKPAKAA